LDPPLGFIGDVDQLLAARSYVASLEHA
jgi:hypothetical protein